MKPWLFDILACPIDKHFPLKLYIFAFETGQDEFESIFNVYEKRDLDQIKKEEIIKIQTENENSYIKDNVIIEMNPIEVYIETKDYTKSSNLLSLYKNFLRNCLSFWIKKKNLRVLGKHISYLSLLILSHAPIFIF